MPRKPACESDDIIRVISAAKEQIIIGQNIAVPSEKVCRFKPTTEQQSFSKESLYFCQDKQAQYMANP